MKRILITLLILVVGFSINIIAEDYQEAPMLKEKVEEGDLPPVEERLPEEPLVWDNEWDHEVGEYGGNLRFSTFRFRNAIACTGFGRYTIDRKDVVPDLAKSWDFEDNYKTLTINLRKGVKWSDGEPFTAEDLMFWWDDIIHSEFQDEPMAITGMNTQKDELVKINDYTIQFQFAEPRPSFWFMTRAMDGGDQGFHFTVPKHYMKKYHPKYNPKEGEDLEEQFLEFMDFVNLQEYRDPDRPVLWAWKPVAYEEDQISKWERNPYFWVVDKEGNQLPYIDTLSSPLLEDGDREAINMRIIAGDLDWERRIGSVTDLPLYHDHKEEAGLQIIQTLKPEGSQQGLYLNYNHKDPELGEIIRNEPKFRRALSLAIDRKAINETAYFGLGKVGHGFSFPGEYDPEIDGAWIAEDIEKGREQARKMLDEIGLDKKNNEGYRLLPNGEPLTLSIMFVPEWHPGAQEGAEFAAEGWEEIGIDATTRTVDHSLRTTREEADEYDAKIDPWTGGHPTMAFRYGFGSAGKLNVGDQWNWWRNRNLSEDEMPAGAKKPIGIMKEMLQLKENIEEATPFSEEFNKLIKRYREIMAEEMFVMGFVQDVPHLLIANENLRNLPGQDNPDKPDILLGAGDEEFYPRSWYYINQD